MKVGDIWLDKFGDYLLVTAVDKVNTRSKDGKFFLFVSAILMTNFTNDPDITAGEFIDDYVVEYIMEKIA